MLTVLTVCQSVAQSGARVAETRSDPMEMRGLMIRWAECKKVVTCRGCRLKWLCLKEAAMKYFTVFSDSFFFFFAVGLRRNRTNFGLNVPLLWHKQIKVINRTVLLWYLIFNGTCFSLHVHYTRKLLWIIKHSHEVKLQWKASKWKGISFFI
jgi:hypothetical protein